MAMKVCGISDIHGNLGFEIPAGKGVDVITLSGDFSPLQSQRHFQEIITWCDRKFIPWIKRNLEKSGAKWFVFCAGNHDFACENPNWRRELYIILEKHGMCGQIIYLDNEAVVLNGKNIFGCPYSDIPGWAFSVTTGNEFGYKAIQDDIDLLIVHQAPNYHDLGTSNIGTAWERNFGSDKLLKEIEKRNIKVVQCGHIHSGYHGDNVEKDGVRYYNCSMLNENYSLAYKPQIFDI